MSSPSYQLLHMEPSDSESEKEPSSTVLLRTNSPLTLCFASGAMTLLLVLSLSTNIIFALAQLRIQKDERGLERSQYASLARNFNVPYTVDTVYVSKNKTAAEIAWREIDQSIDQGMIAFPDSEAEKLGLPKAQRWPWDHTKGIYVLNGYHQLHCVQVIRQALEEALDRRPPTWSRFHAEHCFETLRQEVMCQADDTPMYTGRVHSQVNEPRPVSGEGQQRRCRDWKQLHEWAQKYSACYKRRYGVDEDLPLKERYKFCPDGSVHWPAD